MFLAVDCGCLAERIVAKYIFQRGLRFLEELFSKVLWSFRHL